MSVSRTFDVLSQRLAQAPTSACLAARQAGHWHIQDVQQVQQAANAVSLGLRQLGVGRGDTVAIVSPSRPEWLQADFGIAQLGAVSVPLYPTITTEDYRYILAEAGAKVVLVADEALHGRVQAAVKELAHQPTIFTFNAVAGARPFQELLDLGAGADAATLLPLKAAVQPSDLLTMIYTSGTTGRPKGVMLTHDNLLSNCRNCQRFVPFKAGDKALSFLPLCHIFERMVTYLYLLNGMSIYYAENLDTIGANLLEVKPQGFATVPRLLEKVYDRIVAKGHEQTGLKKRLFFWALNLGLRYDTQQNQGFFYNAQLALARRLVFSKWRQALGGHLRCIVSGGGALQPRLARVFWAAGIRVMEGYGLTETSPVIAVSGYEPENNKIGCVGPLVDNTEVKIAEDGEILTRSASVMKGYYKQPGLTAEVLDADGWFRTGDIGEFVDGRFLKITDRKKEMFKTSGGKYVAPQLLENKLQESRFVEQVMVVGDGERFPGALIVPAMTVLQAWAAERGLTAASPAALLTEAPVQELFTKVVQQANAAFAQWEQVKKFALLPTPWTVESGELTPTMKLKRKAISSRNQELIQGLYR